MANLNDTKLKIVEMAHLARGMWQLTHQAFMEHNLELFPDILAEENKMNDLEKECTRELIDIARNSSDEKEKESVVIYTYVVSDLELIGDYCKDVLERIQIKIEERLMFHEAAVKDYVTLYEKTEGALTEVVYAFEQDNPLTLKDVLKREEHIDTLIDEFRVQHTLRLIDALCSPLACNMFSNMLDFAAAVYYHTKKIARNLLKLKNGNPV